MAEQFYLDDNNDRTWVEKGEQFDKPCSPRCVVTVGVDNQPITFPQYKVGDLQRSGCQATSSLYTNTC